MAEIDPAPYKAALDQATAQRAEDAAMLQSAQLDLQRYQALAKKNFAPIQQVDNQQATVNKDVAAVQHDTAAIETAQINLNYCVIHSPINGRVGLYQIDAGNLIEVASQTGTGILSITQDKPIAVVFTLPEAELDQVQAARAKGAVPVRPPTARIRARCSPPARCWLHPTTRSILRQERISLKATFANNDDRLWPGQFVNTRVQVNTLRKVVTIPLPAVQHGPERAVRLCRQTGPDGQPGQHPGRVIRMTGRSVVTKGLSGQGDRCGLRPVAAVIGQPRQGDECSENRPPLGHRRDQHTASPS